MCYNLWDGYIEVALSCRQLLCILDTVEDTNKSQNNCCVCIVQRATREKVYMHRGAKALREGFLKKVTVFRSRHKVSELAERREKRRQRCCRPRKGPVQMPGAMRASPVRFPKSWTISHASEHSSVNNSCTNY